MSNGEFKMSTVWGDNNNSAVNLALKKFSSYIKHRNYQKQKSLSK